ncbi:phosphatidylinositol-specific phospholipase C domain-containing protein [Paenibacillus tyrfis]|uniref:1-phosphatidylinositol phosphodiesterase n=1 Tax=Paenibacillus tyrfis TaxID=1501230 RepID=A0A081P213_9BACL|nr:phosphatidylinositol-specific phospholipase C domain-containing protein [Paenibacillus tyrfis]KEQ24736.1 hypothetical protein ET33_06560 [Paenibacillus tyrfis]
MEDKMKKTPKDLIPNAGESALDRYNKFRDGYAYASNIGHTNKNWMGQLPGDTTMSRLSIPGTHNSMSLHGGGGPYPDDFIITQTMNLQTQLNSGIRYLDIRLRKASDTRLEAYHGSVNQKAEFGANILNTAKEFLRANPSETILMRVKNECTGSGAGNCKDASTSKTWAQVFEDAYYNNLNYRDYFWKGTSNDPQLKDVRGKIVVLPQFPTDNKRFGIPYGNLKVQDEYNVEQSANAMYSKWTAVGNHLKTANAHTGKNIYLNHLSGNGTWWFISHGAKPWFVASGYNTRSTGSSPKSTSTGIGNWPDFPRTYSTIYYGGTNILTAQYIQQWGLHHAGIIAADFPGKTLIQQVIKLNDRLHGGDSVNIQAVGSDVVKVGFTGETYKRNSYEIRLNGAYIASMEPDPNRPGEMRAFYASLVKTDVGLNLFRSNLKLFANDKIEVFVRTANGQTLVKSQTLTIHDNPGEEVQVKDGTYRITSTLKLSSLVDMSKSSDRNVVLYNSQNQLNGEWNFKYDTTKKAYHITNRWDPTRALAWNSSAGSINVFGAGIAKSKDEQYWILKRTGDGYLHLVNKKNDTVLDVQGGQTANWTNINAWGLVEGENNQKFKLVERKEKLEGQINSNYKPLSGQKNRSSSNFSLPNLQGIDKAQKGRVEIEGHGETLLNFRVMRDRSNNTDPVIWSNLKHGDIIDIPAYSNLTNIYIANPSGYSWDGTFKVKFYTLQ